MDGKRAKAAEILSCSPYRERFEAISRNSSHIGDRIELMGEAGIKWVAIRTALIVGC